MPDEKLARKIGRALSEVRQRRRSLGIRAFSRWHFWTKEDDKLLGLRPDDEVAKLATQISAKSAHVLAIGKEAFYRQAELGVAEAYDYAAEVMTRNMLARDAEEGIDAFIAKRPPVWQDR